MSFNVKVISTLNDKNAHVFSMFCYQLKRSFGQGYVFTGVCDSVHRGGSGKETPPAGWRPPGWMENPPGWMENPPGWKENPPAGWRTPPAGWRTPPGKQTPAYGLRSAGTHPTGMHSCDLCVTRMVSIRLKRFSCCLKFNNTHEKQVALFSGYASSNSFTS